MSVPENELIYDKDFWKDVRRLPSETQDKLVGLITILKEDPFAPLLHTKPLSPPLQGIFAFRITRDWRAGFKFRAPHVIQLLAADRRDKIYKRLLRKIRN